MDRNGCVVAVDIGAFQGDELRRSRSLNSVQVLPEDLLVVGRSWILVAAAGLALLAGPARASEPAWLEVVAPASGEHVHSSVALVAVQGRAVRDTGPRALVIALDLSSSSFLPAGFDVDRDGMVGVLQPWARLDAIRVDHRIVTDPEDTFAHAAVRLAREVAARLDVGHSRVGLVTLSEHTRVRAELEAPAVVLGALDAVDPRDAGGATDIGGAIRRALRVLEPAPASSRAILLVSDGEATAPRSPASAARRALSAAEAAARSGVRVHGVVPSRGPGPRASVLGEIARRSGGRTFAASAPERWVHELISSPAESIADLDVRNQTTGEPARAVRSFVDGSFDGFVALVPGLNRIEIRARLTDGRELGERRLVLYEIPDRPSAEDTARAATLREELRARTAETELALRPAGTRRTLTLAPAAADPADPIAP